MSESFKLYEVEYMIPPMRGIMSMQVRAIGPAVAQMEAEKEFKQRKIDNALIMRVSQLKG